MQTYLSLGDSMSIDMYTGRPGGGAAAQLFRRLGPGWRHVDRSFDGCVIAQVPVDDEGDLITLTIGGNDLILVMDDADIDLDAWARAHRALLEAVRARNPDARFLVSNIYRPALELSARQLELLDLANAAIADHAAACGATLADLRALIDGHEHEWLVAEIEPGLQAATAIADLWHELAGP